MGRAAGTAGLRRRATWQAAGAALLVALLGGLATDISPWYLALRQPPWKPPDAWFGPGWTVIYALAAWSCLEACLHVPPGSARRRIVVLYAINGALNVAWSILFFRAQRPDWALFEVVFLWSSILLLVAVVWRHSRLAAWLLLPYLGWVAFAATLNLAVVQLNGPFGH